VTLETPALREIQVKQGLSDRQEILAVLDRLVRGEIRVTLVSQVTEDNQDWRVLQANVDPEGIQDLVATKDL